MSFHMVISEDIVRSSADTSSALSQAENVMRYIAKTACLDPQIAQFLAERWLRDNAGALGANRATSLLKTGLLDA